MSGQDHGQLRGLLQHGARYRTGAQDNYAVEINPSDCRLQTYRCFSPIAQGINTPRQILCHMPRRSRARAPREIGARSHYGHTDSGNKPQGDRVAGHAHAYGA